MQNNKSNDFFDKIELIIKNTKEHKLNWHQENVRTYYLLEQKDAQEQEVKIIIQYIPPLSITNSLLESLIIGNSMVYVLNVMINNEVKFTSKVNKNDDKFKLFDELYKLVYMKPNNDVSDAMNIFAEK